MRCGGRRPSGGDRLLRAGVALFFLIFLPSAAFAAAGEDAELLTRSIYVPVRIEAGPCLRDVVVRTEGGKIRARVPGRLVAQFAFHPGRRGPEPEWERLRVEGWIRTPAEGDPVADRFFRTGIVITPASIYVGRKRMDLQTIEKLGQFRRRVDLRMPELTLRLSPPECAPSLREDARLREPSAPR